MRWLSQVFQAIVLEEPPTGTLTQNCVFFMKKLRVAIEQHQRLHAQSDRRQQACKNL